MKDALKQIERLLRAAEDAAKDGDSEKADAFTKIADRWLQVRR